MVFHLGRMGRAGLRAGGVLPTRGLRAVYDRALPRGLGWCSFCHRGHPDRRSFLSSCESLAAEVEVLDQLWGGLQYIQTKYLPSGTLPPFPLPLGLLMIPLTEPLCAGWYLGPRIQGKEAWSLLGLKGLRVYSGKEQLETAHSGPLH